MYENFKIFFGYGTPRSTSFPSTLLLCPESVPRIEITRVFKRSLHFWLATLWIVNHPGLGRTGDWGLETEHLSACLDLTDSGLLLVVGCGGGGECTGVAGDTSPQHLEVQYAGFLLLHTTTQHFNTAL